MDSSVKKQKSTKIASKIVWILVLLVSVISCIKFIYEPDIWWQIRTGNWILENSKVPKTDMLSYTYNGDPWINVKWGAEVLMAKINNTLGVELLPLLQIVCLLGIIFLITKIHSFLNIKYYQNSNKSYRLGISISLFLMLLIVNYRLNSRPEMFSHLFTILSLFIILKFKKSNWIFLLIPLQIIWTNMHEAYGIGIVIIFIFLISDWLEFLFFNKRYNFGINYKPIKLTLASALAILCVSINPNGFKMITHPFEILGQLSKNKYTEELISFKMDGYWKYQALLMLLITVFIISKLFKKKDKKTPFLFRPFHKIGTGYSIILVAFLYLSFTSFRNIPFFIFLITPLLATILYKFEIKKKINFQKYYISIIVIYMVFYFSITSNYFYQKVNPQENYGLQINSKNNPIGSASFIKENNIKGKGFVDYLSSSYFMYADTSFRSFIDLRDLDVYNNNFFNYVFSTYQKPEVLNNFKNNGKSFWQNLDDIDNFDYVVILNSPQFKNMNQFFMHRNSNYELVYADNLNSVYLKNNQTNKQIIEKFGFKNTKKNVFHPMKVIPANDLANFISKLFNPFYINEKPSLKNEFRIQQDNYFLYMNVNFNVK